MKEGNEKSWLNTPALWSVVVLIGLLLLVLSGPSAWASEGIPNLFSMAEELQKTVVHIRISKPDPGTGNARDDSVAEEGSREELTPGIPVFLSSGVLVKDNLVLSGNFFPQNGRLSVILFNGRQCRAHLVARSPLTNLALLEILPSMAIEPAEIDRSGRLQIKDVIFAMANPLGFDYTVALGRILAKPAGSRIVRISAAITSDSTGGPVFDTDGKLIGISRDLALAPEADGMLPIKEALRAFPRLSRSRTPSYG